METIAVVGAGLMGHGIAQIFALEGYAVRLTDVHANVLDAALGYISANLGLLAEHGIIQKDVVQPALRRITTFTDIADAVEGAGFVVEAVSENLELKQDIFKTLDAVCPEQCILATNANAGSSANNDHEKIARETVHNLQLKLLKNQFECFITVFTVGAKINAKTRVK